MLSVNPSVPAKSVKELVALIAAYPGKYSYASPGAGTQAHPPASRPLSLGLDLVTPLQRAGPAIALVVAGHTPSA